MKKRVIRRCQLEKKEEIKKKTVQANVYNERKQHRQMSKVQYYQRRFDKQKKKEKI